MSKPGPKSGFNEKIQETFIRLTRKGKTLEQIAEVVGVTSRTLSNWMGKHPGLLHAVRESRQVADELVEASLFQRACGYTHAEEKVFQYEGGVVRAETLKHYPPDTQAAMFWLRNRQPEAWKEKTEGDVTVNNNLSSAALTDEQLEARISAHLAKHPAPPPASQQGAQPAESPKGAQDPGPSDSAGHPIPPGDEGDLA